MYLMVAFLPVVIALILIEYMGVEGFLDRGLLIPFFAVGLVAPTAGAFVVAWMMSGSFTPVYNLFGRPIGFRTVALALTGQVVVLGGTWFLLGQVFGADFGVIENVTTLVGVSVTFLVGGFTEEIGWRGTLQPALQARFGPLPGVLTVGAVHGVWHLPLHVIEGTPPVGFTLILCGLLGAAVFHGWAFNAAERVYAPAFTHALGNIIGLWTTPALVLAGEIEQALIIASGWVLLGIIVAVATRGRIGLSNQAQGSRSITTEAR
ncbi:CPBP family intramembrane glutamic endopeptidase [Salinigranum salinum]|uniref:CPBP family intramembrane glutamic endopeptidase n=1 Tax=Salinigranum salinum TaxID=1364937 RepID=UPI001863EF9D|nr:CPBP family intramembrane glutamic endopeptidase [Salinigranum salinum]